MRLNFEKIAILFAFIIAGTMALRWAMTAHWKEFISKEGAFSVLMPAKPTEETHSFAIGAVKVEGHSFSAESQSNAEFIVTYADAPTAPSPELTEKVLDVQSQALTEGDANRLLSSEKSTVNGYPVRQYKATTEAGSEADEKLLLVKRRLYVLLVVHAKNENENEVKTFFDSFRFRPID